MWQDTDDDKRAFRTAMETAEHGAGSRVTGDGKQHGTKNAGPQSIAAYNGNRRVELSDLFNKLARRVPSHWRGPAGILDIDKTGVAVKSQIRTFKVARNC